MLGTIFLAAALAGEPARYALSSEVALPPTGPVLIDLTELATQAQRDDLLLQDGAGNDVPYRILGSWEPQQGSCAPAKWDPVGPPPRYSRIRVDTRSVGRTIDRIVLDPGTVGSGLFSGAVNVFFGDGSYAMPITIEQNGREITTGLIWRANIAHADRENMSISVDALPPGVYDIVAPGALRWRGVSVCWTATTDVRPIEATVDVIGPVPIAAGRTRYEIALPAAGLDLIDITLGLSDDRFLREVDVYTPSPDSSVDGPTMALVGTGAIERLSLGGATIDHTVLEIGGERGRRVGSRLILEVADERDRPLAITRATVRYTNRAMLLNDAGEGPHTLYAAPFLPEPGDYDIGHATVELLRSKPPVMRPVAIGENPRFNPAEIFPSALFLGGEADTKGYTSSREILSGQAGRPTRWHLDNATLADVGDTLYSIRVVNAEGLQVPYVLESAGWERIESTFARVEESGRTKLTVTLPGTYRPKTVVLRCDDAVFSRRVAVLQSKGGSGEWRNLLSGGGGTLTLPLYGTLDSFEILIENGDDAPLGTMWLEVWGDTLDLLAIDPGPGAALWYGNPKATVPSYDLAMMSTVLRLGAVLEGQLGPVARHTRASAADKKLALVAVAALALVLLGLAVMLVRDPEASA